MKLLLFDIDGTLLKPMGVGKRAFLKSLEKKFGKIKEPPNFTYDGLLDIEIVNKSLELMGAQATEEEKKEILKDYVSNLKYELPQNKKDWLCPNVPGILSKAEEKKFALSIVTGNIKEAAEIKLSSTGIDNYFPTGAYGDDADERWKLIGIARRKAEEHYNTFFDIKDVFMIGDSLRDIVAARKNGVKVISVATGLTSFEQLQKAEPDYILESFEYTDFLEEI